MVQLPSGTVTFLFTDIEGSTKRWEQLPEAMAGALRRHNQLLSEAIAARGGFVFKTVGDAFCAAFARADDALVAALAAQRALQAEEWDGVVGDGARERIRVRLERSGVPVWVWIVAGAGALVAAGIAAAVLLATRENSDSLLGLPMVGAP